MKRVDIDADFCQGARVCSSIAAEAVEFDDDGIAQATDAVLPDEIAIRMEDACPGMAISVTDVQAGQTDDRN